jgi:hypothetical protein
MKWYSVRKHKPTQYCACLLLRLEAKNGCWFLTLGEYDSNDFLDWDNKETVEFDDYKVTHFCIPDPIEIEIE